MRPQYTGRQQQAALLPSCVLRTWALMLAILLFQPVKYSLQKTIHKHIQHKHSVA